MKDLDAISEKLDNFPDSVLIASGSFSRVYRYLDHRDGSLRAIKIAKALELCRRASVQDVNRGNVALNRTEVFGWGSEFLSEDNLSGVLTPAELLRRQAAKLSVCDDASLVKVIETGVANDQTYLSMEYLPGPTLRELLCHGRARLQTLIEVLEGLCRLARNTHFGHHGDLKPENIIVTGGGAKMIDPGHFPGNDAQVVYSSPDRRCVTTSTYYPLLQPNDSVACGAMLWEIVLGCQPFTAWEEPNPEIGPRLAEFEGFALHPIFRRPYFGGAWRLHSVRRPKSIIPGISEELETFLLRAIGMELDADGRLETLRGDISVPFFEGGIVMEVKGFKEEWGWYSTLHEGLIRYHDALQELQSPL